MANQITDPAMKPLQSTPLGGMTSVMQGGLNNLIGSGKGFLDRFFPPQKREEMKNKLLKFATENPKMASFLFSQFAISGLPLALFVVFTVTVVVFCLLGALILALLAAVLFAVLMVGFALIILFPVLFFTTFSASFIWLWGLGTYYFIKWFNEKPVPGVHTSMKDGIMGAMGVNDAGSWAGANDQMTDSKMPKAHEQDPSKRKGQKPQQDGDNEDQTPSKKSNAKPLAEKKDGANTAKRSDERSPSAAVKNPAKKLQSTGTDSAKKVQSTGTDSANKLQSTGTDVGSNVGGQLKQKTGAVGNVTNGLGVSVL